jgi:hypothetical protein
VKAHVGFQRRVVEDRPEEEWLKAMLVAAEAWAEHRGAQ